MCKEAKDFTFNNSNQNGPEDGNPFGEKERYLLPTEGKMIEVTKAQYQSFYQHKRREKYLEERDRAHNLQHYSDLDTDEILGEEMFSYPEEIGVEEKVINKMLLDTLLQCLRELPKEDQIVIQTLFYQNKTEREYAEELGLTQSTIHYHRNRIIAAIRKKMNIL